MLIAQVTDIHIGFRRNDPAEPNLLRLRRVLGCLTDRPDRPDLLLLTGDLTEYGDAESYAVLAQALSGLPFPVWPMPGNHDDRLALVRAFPQLPAREGPLDHVIEAADLRIAMIDSLEPGRHGGSFTEAQAEWLSAELAAHPRRPTLVVIHHPPLISGIDWMDPGSSEPWIARLGHVLAGQPQVKAILCGHLHRPVVSVFAGHPVIVCPSSAPALALNLAMVDPDRPDGRTMVLAEPPGFALHRWDGAQLVTHFGQADDAPAVAVYDEAFQPVVRTMAAERS